MAKETNCFGYRFKLTMISINGITFFVKEHPCSENGKTSITNGQISNLLNLEQGEGIVVG